MKYNGKWLIEHSFKPSKHFTKFLEDANYYASIGVPEESILTYLNSKQEEITEYESRNIELQNPILVNVNYFIDNEDNELAQENLESVKRHVEELRKIPTIRSISVMPDACPAGAVLGTIPVGGVAVAENAIHPGMHSADICCSLFLTSFDKYIDVGKVLDAIQKVSHFGVGGRKDLPTDDSILAKAANNKFLNNPNMFNAMNEHNGTQGDGNHFFYVGTKKSNGDMTFVTHHGSRKPGALLYKAGMSAALEYTKNHAKDVPKHNSWIPYNTDDGKEYWEALQIIREWTKFNHTTIHKEVMRELGLSNKNITDRFWNEHNFVFKEGDMFHHAKGATPITGKHAHDADINGRTIIPLNMGEPILIATKHNYNISGFAPHGAGRNFSRTAYNNANSSKTIEQAMQEQVSHIDARFYSGKPDMSELPDAYKNASEIKRQIKKYELAEIVDEILPLGSIMCGEVFKPWLKNKKN